MEEAGEASSKGAGVASSRVEVGEANRAEVDGEDNKKGAGEASSKEEGDGVANKEEEVKEDKTTGI